MAVLTSGVRSENAREKFSPASSFIEVVEYDPEAQTMDITFHSGTKIRYLRVFPSTFLSFKQSPTHSAYYARAIKGNVLSTKIVDAGIGRQESTPLKKIQKEQPLDVGLRKQLAESDRKFGTVSRAFGASAAAS